MKRFFRILCVGLVAMCIAATSSAEVRDVTVEYLRNADMEQGVKYWGLDGDRLLLKNTKNPSRQVGFYGMNQGVLEAWNSNPNLPLGDSRTFQKIPNLPNGTYVFGAYVLATQQNARERISDKEYRYWSNREEIQGVSLFANSNEIPVATDNPDWGTMYKWAHSSKFNVATVVTDNTLQVGLKVEDTNANYVAWDNVTLYYFGDMSEADALDAMAEIDMENAVEIADTMLDVKMNVDTLENLRVAIENAIVNTTTAATLWDDNEMLFWNIGLARKSQNDYALLRRDIETATKVLGYEVLWVVDYVSMLEEALEEAQAAYDAAELDRKGLTELRNELNYYVGAVKFDSLYVAWDDLLLFMEEVWNLEGQPGGYSRQQYATLEALSEELIDTICYFEENWGEPYDEELFNPNDLWPYVARVYAAIQNVKDNPIAHDFTKMPVVIPAGEDGRVEGATLIAFGAYNGLYQYSSPLYTFEAPVENLKITVKKSASGSPFFCLSKLAFYDADGELIELTEDNVSSEYDHNKLNYSPDGDGVPGMLDDDAATYFHSAWNNSPAGYHSLDIVLPNGGYTAFSFQMISRRGLSHQFPGEIEVSTPMPNRASLESLLARAKAYNAYSNGEVGFYAKDFSYLTDLVIEIETALEGYPSEEDCRELVNRLRTAIARFELEEDKEINLPVPGKEYHIVSGYPAFYEKQFVEKAITVHTDTVKSLWWENAAADSLNQKFVFDPILVDDEHYIYNEITDNVDGSTTVTSYYAYTVKNVATGAFINNQLHLVEESTDTVFLKPLGRGQWNIIVRDHVFHTGDHNGGNISGANGAYGGTWGVSSAIVAWRDGIDSPSSWFIREMPEMPLTQLVTAGEYKSECFHFAPTNTITLTAEGCAFENLALYDLYGKAIAVDTIVVDGGKATITTPNNIVGCAFAFTNNEGVSSVLFDTENYSNTTIALLQEAYATAIAVNPQKGTDVMQYSDITAYTLALDKARTMLETGAEDEAIYDMITELEEAVAGLVPNMPVPDRMYYIVSAMDAFVEKHGVGMMIYDDNEGQARWAYENLYNLNRCWMFEPAEEEDGYYLKNVGTGMYLGACTGMSSQVAMVYEKHETTPYTLTSLGGDVAAIASNVNEGYRLHAAGHSGGIGLAGTIVYWNSGVGTASAWRICDAEEYGLQGFIENVMKSQSVETRSSSIVNIPVEMMNGGAVTAFQFDLYLPEDVRAVYNVEDGDVLYEIIYNNKRVKSSHMIAAEPQADGSLRVVGYSTNNVAFVGNSGVLLNVAVSVGNLIDGDYEIVMRNIRMVAADGVEYVAEDYTSTLTIKNAILGDVNGDYLHTMSDVVMMVNAVLQRPQSNFEASVADMNGDGTITMGDVVNVLRLVLTDGSTKAPARSKPSGIVVEPELSIGELGAVGNDRVVLPVVLKNREAYSAFQLDVELPAGVELSEVTLTGRAKATHSIAWDRLDDGCVRVVAYALDNAAFRGNEGTLLNLVLDTSAKPSADVAINLTDGLFCSVNGAEHRAPDVNIMLRSGVTGVEETNVTVFRAYGVESAVVVECSADASIVIYAVTGQLVQHTVVKAGKHTITLPAGVYVVNGNKVVVR